MRMANDQQCLLCQNQTVANSQADLAIDLRNQVRDMLQCGKSEAEITDTMAARCGEFVLYLPALRPRTWLLWFGPAALVLGGLGACYGCCARPGRQMAAMAASSTSTQCCTGVLVPLCRWVIQPILADTITSLFTAAKWPSLRSRNW